ncbi:MAG: divergent polysaccharide deacetylase family protein [Alphaproteobacteria bacterium]|nr:MAG: divergent polysaccharide deacetylase family protein [Alphaproteobacteria bacterium]
MAQPSDQEKSETESETVLTLNSRLIDTPVRLAILCAAVLLISICGGILFGRLFGAGEADPASKARLQVAAEESQTTADEMAHYKQDSLDRAQDEQETVHVKMRTKGQAEANALAAVAPVIKADEKVDPGLVAMPKDKPAWKKYAALAPPVNGSPMIALVIDDMGLSMDRVKAVSELPATLTLSFLPYATSLQMKADYARDHGHEIMLHLPMEPLNSHLDPGPDALMTNLPDDELRRRTIKNLDSFTGYVGVNNHMGSKFTSNEHAMSVFMDVMAERGLLFLDSKTIAKSWGYKLAVSHGMPAIKRDIFIDDVISRKAIDEQLDRIRRVAEKKGVVIAIGHPHPKTVEALQDWLPKMKKAGFRFVPVSVVTALTFNG